MKKVFLLITMMLLFAFFQPIKSEAATPPDVINSWNITVTPNEKGSLEIKYEFDYTATTDFPSNGAYLEIGVPNRNFQIIDYGPKDLVVKATSKEGSQSQIRLDFSHLPLAKENLKFFFTINQDKMANYKDEEIVFEFTPGWFDFAEIKKLTILWKIPDDHSLIKFTNPDPFETRSNEIVWTAENMKTNQKFTVQIKYDPAAFPGFDETNQSEESEGASICLGVFIVILAIIVTMLILYLIFDGSDYGSGGYIGGGGGIFTGGGGSSRSGGGSSGYSGRGSSSSCVSSCACACACAGGGRAGCNEKGFGIKSFLTKNPEKDGRDENI